MRRVFARRIDADAGTDAGASAFAADVQHYLRLSPRQLPSRYLYDALGSALFDAICELPWYPITQAELRLLAAHAQAILGGEWTAERVIELGAGDGRKLAALLAAGLPPGQTPTVHLVDVSATALAAAARAIGGLDHPLDVVTHQMTYQEGLGHAGGHGRRLVLFLGSNIGNFDPSAARALLSEVWRRLSGGDRLLIGVDLVKPEARLLQAYDDPLQVTAAFNRNLLVRINRELDADFVVEQFGHVALWNAQASRIEMHLESRRLQRVSIGRAALSITFGAGERIWTESSYKFTAAGVRQLLRQCGFRPVQQWIDEPGQFALTIAEA
jgi:dimethylhistidine N-methyltransferase